MPFGQFSSIYLETADGLHFHLVSDNANDRMNGLLLVRTVQAPEPVLEVLGSLLRTRLLDLPTGTAKLSVHREGPGEAVLDASLEIGGQVIRLLCGEVYARQDGSFKLVTPNESVLVS